MGTFRKWEREKCRHTGICTSAGSSDDSLVYFKSIRLKSEFDLISFDKSGTHTREYRVPDWAGSFPSEYHGMYGISDTNIL